MLRKAGASSIYLPYTTVSSTSLGLLYSGIIYKSKNTLLGYFINNKM